MKASLTADEIQMGATHAICRRHKKHSGLRGDRQQKEESSWDNEINGALAEMALCKHRGKYWAGAERIHATDGGDVEVRWTKHQGRGGLIVYHHDDDEKVYVLAEGGPQEFNYVGYLRGAEAKTLAKRVSFGLLVDRSHLKSLGDKQ